MCLKKSSMKWTRFFTENNKITCTNCNKFILLSYQIHETHPGDPISLRLSDVEIYMPLVIKTHARKCILGNSD